MPRDDLPHRPGVGVVLFDARGLVFVGRRVRRVGDEVWQFPQGGVDDGETWLQAALRELEEETGVRSVVLVARMAGSVDYDLPADLPNPPKWASRYRGQRQRWFALRFVGPADEIRLDGNHPEFDAYRWLPLPETADLAVAFKRAVYTKVAREFAEIASYLEATARDHAAARRSAGADPDAAAAVELLIRYADARNRWETEQDLAARDQKRAGTWTGVDFKAASRSLAAVVEPFWVGQPPGVMSLGWPPSRSHRIRVRSIDRSADGLTIQTDEGFSPHLPGASHVVRTVLVPSDDGWRIRAREQLGRDRTWVPTD